MDERNIISFSFDSEVTFRGKLDRDFDGAIDMVVIIYLILYEGKLEFHCSSLIPAGIYLIKINNRNIRTRYEICCC